MPFVGQPYHKKITKNQTKTKKDQKTTQFNSSLSYKKQNLNYSESILGIFTILHQTHFPRLNSSKTIALTLVASRRVKF